MNRSLLFVLLTACGGAAFRAGTSSDDIQLEDAGVRQGYTDGGYWLPGADGGVEDSALSIADSDVASDACSDAQPVNEDAGPPTTAAEADDTVGCCFGNTFYYGNDVNGMYNLVSVNCTDLHAECAWMGDIGGSNRYGCADPSNVTDASGPPGYPIMCR